MKNQADIIIIGSGASGLMAGKMLTAAGKKVLIIEGKSEAGGRIKTFNWKFTNEFVEAGAEFIHGDLKTTMGLLKEGNISTTLIKGMSLQFKDGHFKYDESFIEDWPLLMDKLNELKEDISMMDFLTRYFSDEKYADMRKSVRNFLEGYDAASIDKVSAIALRDEWAGDHEAKQYRINGGYGKLVNFLQDTCTEKGAEFYFNYVVREINWKQGSAEVITQDGSSFVANQVLVTIPLGVLSASQESVGAITFNPQLSGKKEAIQKMGYGSVIKILLNFKRPFWKEKPLSEKKAIGKSFSFLFSDAEIPTWWTQDPIESGLLTGWLAGPKAAALEKTADSKIIDMALDSLSYIFDISKEELENLISETAVYNWSADPFAKGAYSYAAIKHTYSMQLVKAPVEETIYFAGEAFYEGPEIGTVEAALNSGMEAATAILKLI